MSFSQLPDDVQEQYAVNMNQPMSYSFASLPPDFQRQFLEKHIEGRYSNSRNSEYDADWDETARVGPLPDLLEEGENYPRPKSARERIKTIHDHNLINYSMHRRNPDAREIVASYTKILQALQKLATQSEYRLMSLEINLTKRREACLTGGSDPETDEQMQSLLRRINDERKSIANNEKEIAMFETAQEKYQDYLHQMGIIMLQLSKQNEEEQNKMRKGKTNYLCCIS